MFMHKQLVRFNAPKGTEGGDPPAEPAAPAGNQTTPDGAGNAGKFTQEDLDRFAAERGKHAKSAARKEFFEALGVKDDAEFEAYLKAKKEREDAEKSDLEKLAGEVDTQKKRAERIEAESRETIETLQKRILDSEIKRQAMMPATDKEGKITRPAFHPEFVEDIPLLIDCSGITDENGTISGIGKALEELAKAKPRMLGEQTPGERGPGTPPGGVKPPKSQTQPKTGENAAQKLRL